MGIRKPPYKVGDLIRHKKDRDICLITGLDTSGCLYGETVFGGNKHFRVGSSDHITPDLYEEWELTDESVVDKILTKYSNEN